MTEAELLKRIDRHMERGNVLAERVGEELVLLREEVGLMREMHAEYMAEMVDVRRGYRIAVSQLTQLARESRDAMREMREASKSHTRALLSLLDRLDDGGASPAAG